METVFDPHELYSSTWLLLLRSGRWICSQNIISSSSNSLSQFQLNILGLQMETSLTEPTGLTLESVMKKIGLPLFKNWKFELHTVCNRVLLCSVVEVEGVAIENRRSVYVASYKYVLSDIEKNNEFIDFPFGSY